MNRFRRPTFLRNLFQESNKIFSHPLFWIGLTIKLVCAALFASDYLLDLFVPFVDHYVKMGGDGGTSNPYAHFAALHEGKLFFPYPALMLYIMAVPAWCLFFLPTHFVLRLPLLLADFSILLVLAYWTKAPVRRLLRLYWISPVLIYITYIHGQLDVIPIAVLFASLYALFKERFVMAFLLLGLSLATKTNILLIVPFCFVYLYFRYQNNKRVLLYGLLFPLVFLAVNLPFLFDPAFQDTVFFNDVQNRLFTLAVSYDQAHLFYVFPGVFVLLISAAVVLKIRSRDMFFVFSAFVFCTLLLLVLPSQGWFYWIIPLLVYFYMKSAYRGRILFVALQVAILIYFGFYEHCDYFKVFQPISTEIASWPNFYQVVEARWGAPRADLLANLSFTFLQTVLALNVFWVYKRGVEIQAKQKILSESLLIGIGGNSGAGKSTVARALSGLFGKENITHIKGDDMHRWERGNENWKSYTHLDPKANELHRDYQQLDTLKKRRRIRRQEYDHGTGKFVAKTDKIASNNIVVYDGLHPFYLQKMRDLFDIKIFLKPDDDFAMHCKLVRDVVERGHDREKVLNQIAQRKTDYEKYIVVQEDNADLIISLKLETPLKNIGDPEEKAELYISLRCVNTTNLEPLVEMLAKVPGLRCKHYYDSLDFQTLEIHGVSDKRFVTQLFGQFSASDIGIIDPVWEEGQTGLIQLFLTYYIIDRINAKLN